MRLANFKRLNQRGDTIVEVLIAIAIVSMVLGGAYVTTNKSLKATRNAQEHTNALKLVEGQVEQIKSVAGGSNPDNVFTGINPFCIDNGVVVAPTAAACRVNSAGAPTTAEPIYRLSATRTGSNLFTVTVTWSSITGNPSASEKMVYRIYR